MLVKLHINGESVEVNARENELLVWVINEKLGLTNTRFGCGIEMCGSCKVRIDGEVVHSCVLEMKDVVGKKIVTSEHDPGIRET